MVAKVVSFTSGSSNRYGQTAFDEMYTRWAKGRKYTRLELIALVTEYQEKLAELQKQI